MPPKPAQPDRTPVAYVIGAGGMGLFLQYLLQGSAKSTLICRRGSYERFQASPLRITGALEGTLFVRCRMWENLTELDGLATLFIAVRAHELQATLETLKPRLPHHATVVLCQNGIGVFELANGLLPRTRIFRLTSWLGVERWEVDHLHVAGLYRLEMAGERGDDAQLAHWQSVLSRPGLQTTVAYDPVALEWKKGLFSIATNAVASLANVPNGAVLDTPELRSIAGQLVAETVAVAGLEGVHLTAHDRAAVYQSLEMTRGVVNSTLHDLRRGRRHELPFLNAAVIRAAEKHGQKAPVNELVMNLVTFFERNGRWKPAPPSDPQVS